MKITTNKHLKKLINEVKDRDDKNREFNKIVSHFLLMTLVLGFLEERGLTAGTLSRFKTLLSRQSFHTITSLEHVALAALEGQAVDTSLLKSILTTIFESTNSDKSHQDKEAKVDVFHKLLESISKSLEKKTELQGYLITENFVGSLIQDLLSDDEKKKSGSYYTPDVITKFIATVTLERYLVDGLNKRFNVSLKSLNEVLQVQKSNTKVAAHLLVLLERVKILEPTMGAGHFVIAMIKVLSDTWMNVLLSNPRIRKKFFLGLDNQTRRLIEKTGIEEDNDSFRALLKSIIMVTRCIPALYGADLNPTAVMACKTRIFITLVDSMPKEFLNKFIPFISGRLRFNFVVGDSLLGFPRVNDFRSFLTENLTNQDCEEIVHELKLMKDSLERWISQDVLKITKTTADWNQFFLQSLNKFYQMVRLSITHANDVKKFQKGINSLLNDYLILKDKFSRTSELLSVDDRINEIMKELDRIIVATLNSIWRKIFVPNEIEKHANTQPIHWFLTFPEVFNKRDGFDLVIGNPPYLVEVRNNKDIFRILKRTSLGKKYYEQKIDIFYLFISLGIDLLEIGGLLGFIVPEYWTNRRFAQKLRKKIFSETVPLLFVFFGDHPVFPHAPGHHDMILILEKRPPQSNLEERETVIWRHDCEGEKCIRNYPLDWLLEATSRKKFINEEVIPTRLLYDANSDILHVSAPHQMIKFKRMKANAWFLKPSEIQLGLTAPQNEVTTRALNKFVNPPWKVGEGIFALRLLELKQYAWTDDEKKLFGMFFTARDFGAFEFPTTIRRLILYMDQENLKKLKQFPEQYHNVKKHLNRFKQLITSDHGPYGLHRARQPIWFEDENKIIGVRKTSQPRFSVVPLPYHVDLSCIILRLHHHERVSPYFAVGVLNSSVGREVLHYLKHQGEQLQVDKSVLLKFPFPSPTSEYHEIISWLSKSLHCIKIAQHYREVDKAVSFVLFDLLEEVITALIEQQAPLKKFQVLLKAAMPLAYPSWLTLPSITEIMTASSSHFVIKINKHLMERDLHSIMRFLKSLN